MQINYQNNINFGASFLGQVINRNRALAKYGVGNLVDGVLNVPVYINLSITNNFVVSLGNYTINPVTKVKTLLTSYVPSTGKRGFPDGTIFNIKIYGAEQGTFSITFEQFANYKVIWDPSAKIHWVDGIAPTITIGGTPDVPIYDKISLQRNPGYYEGMYTLNMKEDA